MQALRTARPPLPPPSSCVVLYWQAVRVLGRGVAGRGGSRMHPWAPGRPVYGIHGIARQDSVSVAWLPPCIVMVSRRRHCPLHSPSPTPPPLNRIGFGPARMEHGSPRTFHPTGETFFFLFTTSCWLRRRTPAICQFGLKRSSGRKVHDASGGAWAGTGAGLRVM